MLDAEVTVARAQPGSSDHPIDRLVGDSPGIYALRAHIRHLAAFDTVGNPSVPTLLLHGETGTGKGLVARIIHDSGPRAHSAFIEINCAAIPDTLLEAELFGFEAGAFTDAKRSKPGLFEAASGGTLFLDEVDTLPLSLQGKFLAAIEEKRVRRIGAMAGHPVDIKLLVATQADLSARVAEGRFRADLYYRLAVILLEIPPLRERGGDIVVLARHFLRRYAEAHRLGPKRLSGAAEVWLQGQSWPGNVRELSHLMERVTLLAPEAVLTPDALERLCLPRPRAADRASPEWDGRKRHPRDERAWISQALRQTEGNVVQAARLLGLSRSAMRYRMRRYGIGRPGREELTPLRAVSTTSLPSRPLPFQGSGPGEEGSDHQDHTRALSTPGEACGQDGGWEQKPVAVLVISFTFPAATAPELPRFDPWTLTARWEQCMTEKVTSFGGVLLASTPPLLTAAFGPPHSLNQLPHRAVQAALAIRHLLLEAGRFDAREPCPEVRLAIHLGPLLADVQARASAARALAMGETLTLPVQLLGHAAPGDILVSSQVAGLIEGWFELQARQVPLGCGTSTGSVVYTVAGLRPMQVPRARLGTRVHARFVGRERELAVLRDLQSQVEGRRGQVVGVIGEPGVGKSRLFYEFTRCHRAHPWLLLESTALSYGKTAAYLPVTNLLRAYFQLEEHDEGPRIGEQVAQQLLRLDEASRSDLPAVLTVLNLPVEDPQWQACNPPHRRQRILDALTRLLLRASQVQPVLLLLEDLQWIDTETQALLDRVIDSLPTARILLLVNYRPEYQHGWAGKSSYTQLRLDPLPPQHADALLQALLGDGAELAPLKQRLIDWTDGNPFFLEESVRTLVETQVLVGERGAYRLAGPPQNVRVPASVQAVLAARIDRLSAEAKDLLQSAAIIGRHVPFPLLQAVTTLPEESLRRGLRHLQATEFLYETHLFRELTYTFKHALTQEVAYGSLPERRRCAYHTAIGSRLEELYAGRIDEVVELLAFHFGRSAEAEKAIDYAMLAAEKAQQRWAHVEALAH